MVALPDIRTSERRNVLGAFLTLFGVLAAHVTTETARDALFLTRLPVEQLPWVYLMIAVAAAFVARPRDRARRVGRHMLGSWLFASALVTVGFWFLATPDRPWTLYALYVWSGVFGTITLTWFWLLASELFTLTEAKRLYGVIGAGAVTGAVAGAALASALANVLPARSLLLASAALLAVTAIVPSLILRRPAQPLVAPGGHRRPGTRVCMKTTMRTPYVRRLAFIVVISTITLSLVDYVFKATVVADVPQDELTRWLANFYLMLNLLAVVTQVLLTGTVMQKLGVHRALLFLPVLMVGGGLGLLLGGGIYAALSLKGADGGLRHSLHRTSIELLYLPIPERLRRQTKAFIDVLLQRSAQAVASIAILAAVALGAGEQTLALIAVVTAGLWLMTVIDLRSHYLDMFRATLRSGALPARRDLGELDLTSLEALIRALNHDDPEVLAAMDILAREGRTGLIPALILHHPSEAIVLRALELFARAGEVGFLPVADRLTSDPRPTVRAAALRARTAVDPDVERLLAATADESPLVRTTALAGLLSNHALDEGAAQSALDALQTVEGVDEHVAVLEAIASQPLPIFTPIVLSLAERPEIEVQLAAANAMRALPSGEVLPVLVSMLERHALRLRARAALVAHGARAFDYLREALADETLPEAVRVHLPRTISRFRHQAAVDVLLARLLVEPSGAVRFKILRALGRLAGVDGLHIEPRRVRVAIERDLTAAFQLLAWREALQAAMIEDSARDTMGGELLMTLLRDKHTHAVERVFRLLGLNEPGEDFQAIYRSARSTSRVLQASAVELLDNVLDSELRDPVQALISDRPAAERIAVGARLVGTSPLGYQALLTELVNGGSRSVAAIAEYCARELDLPIRRAAPPVKATDAQKASSPALVTALLGREPAHAR